MVKTIIVKDFDFYKFKLQTELYYFFIVEAHQPTELGQQVRAILCME